MTIRIERLSEKNFSDYEKLTSCESGGGCYCSFWHQKISSMSEWDNRKKENPSLNRQIVFDKMQTGFHVGVLVYADAELIAWVSIGPLTDFHWSWKRVVQVGEMSKSVAGIMCFTMSPEHRGKGLQSSVLKALKQYGKDQGWTAIEAYPFDSSAIEKHKDLVVWPGVSKGYIDAGFTRLGSHWLSNPEMERSLFRLELT